MRCDARYPLHEGIADLLPEARGGRPRRALSEAPWVARSYERTVRPLLQVAVYRRRVDPESELLLYRALLGQSQGPLLDLACGTAPFARRLAAVKGAAPWVALDVSRPMLEEAAAQAREAGVMVDFVRARAPSLPFTDGAFAGVLHTGALPFMADLHRLFREVARVLAPGGRYVASSYVRPAAPWRWLHRRAALHPRSEAELRRALGAAGLVRFERLMLEPFLVVKAERP